MPTKFYDSTFNSFFPRILKIFFIFKPQKVETPLNSKTVQEQMMGIEIYFALNQALSRFKISS